MIKQYEAVPHRVWKHISGKTASIYGSVPYYSDEQAAEWEVVTMGWTIRNHRNGTTGICRPPFATEAEAQAWCDEHNPKFRPAGKGASVLVF
jgi:hypothetical protein